jgi:hypothetical protein
MAYNKLSNYATTISKDVALDTMVVIYHSTRIVEWNDKEIILDSGGYYTFNPECWNEQSMYKPSTVTKKKMNQASLQFNLGYQIYQEEFIWYVSFKDKTIPFKDGMILTR